MEKNELVDEYISEYANIVADYILGKNLLEHFKTVWLLVIEIDLKINEASVNGDNPLILKSIGYDFYVLKDLIDEKIYHLKNTKQIL